MLRFSIALALIAPLCAAIAATCSGRCAGRAAAITQLVNLFAEWRAFNHPQIVRGRPDYSPRQWPPRRRRLPAFQRRLAAIKTRGLERVGRGDYRLVEAEMNGLDFFLRVLKPWARDPGFYQTVFAEMSDVPAHEGPSAEPNIDLHSFTYPLSAADDARLTELIGAVPAMLADAKVNLAGSQAHDLWAYGDRAFNEQAEVLAKLEAGTLIAQRSGRQAAGIAAGRIAAAARRGRAMRAPRPSNSPHWIRSRGAAAHGPVRRRQGQLQLVSEARPAEPVRLRPAAGPASA